MATFLDDARTNASAFFTTNEEAIAAIRAKLPTVQKIKETLDHYTPDIEPRDYSEMVTKGVFNYSIGYRVGTITTLSSDGLFSTFQSGEGTMFLGEDSNIKEKEIQIPCPKEAQQDGQAKIPNAHPKKVCTTKITINPWYFSFNVERTKLREDLYKSTKRKVILSYRQPLIQHKKIYKTTYLVTGVHEIDSTIPTGFSCNDSRGIFRLADGPNKGETTMYGNIVKLAFQGDLINTWEILFQENNNGGDFHYLSVHDEDMPDCIYRAMSSGRPVELKYESLLYQPEFRGETLTNVKSITVQ